MKKMLLFVVFVFVGTCASIEHTNRVNTGWYFIHVNKAECINTEENKLYSPENIMQYMQERKYDCNVENDSADMMRISCQKDNLILNYYFVPSLEKCKRILFLEIFKNGV